MFNVYSAEILVDFGKRIGFYSTYEKAIDAVKNLGEINRVIYDKETYTDEHLQEGMERAKKYICRNGEYVPYSHVRFFVDNCSSPIAIIELTVDREC